VSCREWYEKKLGACPICNREQPAFNKHLSKAKLDNHLYAQAASAESERR